MKAKTDSKTLETIYSLRSIHGTFSTQEVKDEDLQIIIKACVRAANASARQSYSIIVVSDPEEIKKNFVYYGNKALLFCVDFNRILETAKHLGHEFEMSDVLSFVTGSTDTILAAQTAAIAAKSLGIDSLFTNSIHRQDIDKLYETFNLPRQYCFPLIALLLGYPQEEPDYQKGRLDSKGVVHFGKYQKLSKQDLDELVACYDDKERHMGFITDWEKFGYKHYLGWFYKKWCETKTSDRSQKMQAQLKAVGFIE